MKTKFILCFAFVFSTVKLCGQAPVFPKYLSFDLLTINDGLSQGMVNSMVQDHFGFMWFGTKDGLNRYDGYHFVIYRHNPTDSNSLSDNFIQQVFEDSNGRLWIGTSDHGVDLFNRETGMFTHFRHNEKNQNTLSDDRIECITEDRDGAIWISTQNGLNKLTTTAGTGKKNAFISVNITRYFSGYSRIFAASDGTLWGSSIGNISFRIHPSSVDHDQVDTLDVKKYFSFPLEDRGYEKFIGAMVEDTFHKRLYLVSEYSIAAVDTKTGEAEIISTQRNHWGQFGRTLCMDDNEVIWLSERDWLEQFDVRNKKWSRIFPEDHNLAIMLDNTSIAYRDQSGIIWIGTKGYGLLKYNPRSEKFHQTDHESIGWMSATNDGRIFITKAGKLINIFDPSTASYSLSISDSSWFPNIPPTEVGITSSGIQDRNGLFWLSKNCLASFDESRKTYIAYRPTDHFNFPVFVDRDNKIWTGTAEVLSRYDPFEKKFTDFKYPVIPLRVPYDFLQCMWQDASGIFWLGTVSGLLRFDEQKQSWKQFKNIPGDTASLSFDVIFSICPDPADPGKYLWIGTNGGGLNRFDMETGKVRRFGQADGLPNDVVYGILSDDDHHLWMSTNKGISSFDPVMKVFRNFEEKDGLQGNEFNRYAFCKTKDGTLFFGGLNGFNYFKPKDLTDNSFIPPVEITDFKLRNQSVSTTNKNSPLQKPSYLVDKIVLPYSDNMISFEFAAMDFTSPEKNRYRYRLEGFDPDWVQSGYTHAATYTNLDPGTYTFSVLGSNSDGVWNEAGKSIQLVVLPPWYMTWWFRLAVVIAVITFIYTFYRYRLNQTLKLQLVRNRIAQDLHDEIGSNLSNISIFSTVGNSKLEDPEEMRSLFLLIKEYTQTSMEAMSDIVWMINSRNDRFENIIIRMRTLAAEVFEAKNCELQLDFDERLNELTLGMEERKNFYLIFKEAINNIAKYAACNLVRIEMKMNPAAVELIIQDNGKGFDTNTMKHGNGLINMRKRAEVLHGSLQIQSSPGNGTMLNLQFKV